MKENESKSTFYQQLGKLFYAIAASDKSVAPEELETLQAIVNSHWVDTSSDHIDNNAIDIIREFITLQNSEDCPANECFKEFLAFKDLNMALFDDSVSSLILQTANAIASSFSSRNKSELIMLAKLDMAMKKNRSNP